MPAIFATNEARDQVIMDMFKNDEKKVELLDRHDKSLYGQNGLCTRVQNNTADIVSIKEHLSSNKIGKSNFITNLIQIAIGLIALAGLAVALVK